MNVVATVGYGDMFPMTDNERLFFVFLINMGDALFAVAFGLIAGITMQASKNRDSEEFFNKLQSIKDLLKQNGGDQSQRIKVEQYFAYSWHLHKSTNMISIKSISSLLPYRLSKDVVYYSTCELLEPMFQSFGSDNLIKDISQSLEQTIYLPGDFIILKDDIGEEMYFIAEGTVYIIAADKRTVINSLGRGRYFGEIAIFLESSKRTAYVQAETFCSIFILKKKSLDRIKINYPTIAVEFQQEAERRAKETREIEEANKDEQIEEHDNPEDEKRDLERLYSTPPTTKGKQFPEKIFTASRRSSYDMSSMEQITDVRDVNASPCQSFKMRKRLSLFVPK
jgi:CRP-like cAMP-binding protein